MLFAMGVVCDGSCLQVLEDVRKYKLPSKFETSLPLQVRVPVCVSTLCSVLCATG